MTQEDAALRERVRKVLNQALGDHDQSVTHWTDQLLAAIPEPAATPTPPRVELDTGWAEWEGDAYRVHLKDSTSWTTISAVVVAHHGVADHTKRDAKVAELLALKQPAVAPIGYALHQHGEWSFGEEDPHPPLTLDDFAAFDALGEDAVRALNTKKE